MCNSGYIGNDDLSFEACANLIDLNMKNFQSSKNIGIKIPKKYYRKLQLNYDVDRVDSVANKISRINNITNGIYDFDGISLYNVTGESLHTSTFTISGNRGVKKIHNLNLVVSDP